MQYFPNGSQFAVSAIINAAIPVELVNGDPTKFTIPGTGTIPANSYVQINSGWGGINGRASRVKTVGSDTVLLGIDTSEASRYPSDIQDHSLAVATQFFGLSQITQLDKTGGEQQFYQWVYIDDPSGQQFQRPTRKSARALQFTQDYDPSLQWYNELIKLDENQRQAILRITLPTGDQMLYNCFVGFNADPTMVVDQNMQVVANFAPVGGFVRIAAADLQP